ncbi:CotS family spore coat protein [Clostridium niameyense]|uniref:CotS family spore coat protein n=1 Tax=Clostridium niameyense TaxID=1622073 RepID=A0A6M0RAZ2_9CLOT|nr:CotS family spore coat protein [Clostridium niameyense]
MDKLDKEVLMNYNLSLNLFDKFDLEIREVLPIRSVFLLKTDKGEKILKKLDYSIEQLNFIQEVLNYISIRFPRVMSFMKNKENKIYTTYDNEIYCIMNVIKGRECDLNNPLDLKVASLGLGEMHKASMGFNTNFQKNIFLGKMIDNFKTKKKDMKFFKEIANVHDNKTDFDNIFLFYVDYYISQVEESIEVLENSDYYALCKEEDKIAICHHDLAYHNIIIEKEEAYFIDFDYSIIDLKIHDLCNFITKSIKRFAFDIGRTENILDNYCKTNNLDKRELKVLYAMLNFPEDFYSISKNYYTRKKQWGEGVFLNRFIKKCDYKEYREDLLKEFKENIL